MFTSRRNKWLLAITLFLAAGCGREEGNPQQEVGKGNSEKISSGPHTLTPLRTLKIFSHSLYELDVSKDQHRLVATGMDEELSNDSEEIVRVYDLDANQVVRDFNVSAVQTLHAAISSDGNLVAIGDAIDGNCICETESGKTIHEELFSYGSWAHEMAFLDNDRTLLTIVDDNVVALDVETGQEGMRLSSGDPITCYAVLDEGRRVATGSKKGKICVWNVESQSIDAVLDKGPTPPAKVWTMAAATNNKHLVSVTSEQCGKVWDLEAMTELRDLQQVSDLIPEVVFLGDDRHVAAVSGAGPIQVIDISTGAVKAILDVGEVDLLKGVTIMKLSADNTSLFVGMMTGEVHVFDVSAWSEKSPATSVGKRNSQQSRVSQPKRNAAPASPDIETSEQNVGDARTTVLKQLDDAIAKADDRKSKLALNKMRECAEMGPGSLAGEMLLLTGDDLRTLPAEIVTLTHLTDLQLSFNKLDSLPPEIGNLKKLNSLAAFNNQLTRIPDEVWKLGELTSLNLSSNKIAVLPSEIGNLSKLTALRLADNKIAEVPPEIRKLTGLIDLDLAANELTALPSEVFQLTKLTELGLDGNELASLPPDIGNLTELTELQIDRNKLVTLPPEIGLLKKLEQLPLGSNELTSLPPEIGNLTRLTELTLASNKKLTSLPKEIGRLTRLKRLWFHDGGLTTLPAEIGQLVNLTEIQLLRNQLTTLPAEIGQLTKLTWLCVADNELGSLPPEIGQLANLETLILGGNQLKAVPAELGELTNLKVVDLHGNQLTSLPKEIGNLQKLETLNLGFYLLGNENEGNELTTVPPEIGLLVNLKKLQISNNKLSSLPPEIGQLASLESLDLSHNQLSSLPPEIAKLAKLKSLDLATSLITDVDVKHLYPLKGLQRLDISNTHVTAEGVAALKQALPECSIESDY